MKKQLLLLICMFVGLSIQAQNTFPQTTISHNDDPHGRLFAGGALTF